jgi:hypothetical protein
VYWLAAGQLVSSLLTECDRSLLQTAAAKSRACRFFSLFLSALFH